MATEQATSTLLAASEIKGTTVTNLQNQDIGDVDELLIELDDGTVTFLVLSVGGFLGLGSTRVAVPWQAFNISARPDGKVTLKLDATKERLEKAPRIQGKNYERLYAVEGAEPVFVYWEVDYVE
jgi:sporulation protein YlmC with PRC-barrel domain